MIGVDSKLYQIITVVMEVIFLSAVCFFIAIPIYTIPVAILVYCQIGGNIVSDRRLFDFSNINRNKVKYLVLYILVGICSLYSSFMMTQMRDFFISRLIISLIFCFNAIAGILVLKYENAFFITLRNAFFYSMAYFHKTILPVFIYIEVMGKLNGMLPVYAAAAITVLYCYFYFKINYKSIEKIFLQRT